MTDATKCCICEKKREDCFMYYFYHDDDNADTTICGECMGDNYGSWGGFFNENPKLIAYPKTKELQGSVWR